MPERHPLPVGGAARRQARATIAAELHGCVPWRGLPLAALLAAAAERCEAP